MIVWEVSSAILILVALILRFLFRSKLSARARYALWALVLLRLLLPFSIGQARISVPGALEKVSTRMEDSYLEMPLNEVREFESMDAYDAYVTEHKTVSITGQPNSGQREVETVIADEPVRAALPVTIRWTEVVRIVWLAGAAAVALWFVFVNLRFARSLRCGRKIVDMDTALPVYTASGLETPCLFGLLRPAVYLPPEVAEDEALSRYAVAHELTHRRHGDHIWAALRCLCLALHWWNPLVWAAAVLSRRDAELACDEATLEKLGASARQPYGEALIRMTVPDKAYLLRAATMMSGADLKERIRMIAQNRKSVRIALIVVVAALAVAAIFVFAGNSGGGSIFDRAAPDRSTMTLSYLDKEGGKTWTLNDSAKEKQILSELKKVRAVRTTERNAEEFDSPFYGLEIGTRDGNTIRVLWSDGYLIDWKGVVYRFDYPFDSLRDGDWRYRSEIGSASELPNGVYISQADGAWIKDRLTPAPAQTQPVPDGLRMTVTLLTEQAVTVGIENAGGETWTYGKPYSFEVLLDGSWYQVPMRPGDRNYGFIEIGLLLEPGKTVECACSFSGYAPLPPGVYRVVKSGLTAQFELRSDGTGAAREAGDETSQGTSPVDVVREWLPCYRDDSWERFDSFWTEEKRGAHPYPAPNYGLISLEINDVYIDDSPWFRTYAEQLIGSPLAQDWGLTDPENLVSVIAEVKIVYDGALVSPTDGPGVMRLILIRADRLSPWQITDSEWFADVQAVQEEDRLLAQALESAWKLRISSGGETIDPYEMMRFAETWTGDGWLAADGVPAGEALEYEDDIPTIRLGSDGLSFTFAPDVAQARELRVYAKDFSEILLMNAGNAELAALAPGEYYCVLTVAQNGRYIESEGRCEVFGTDCIFRLVVPEEYRFFNSLSAEDLRTLQQADSERFTALMEGWNAEVNMIGEQFVSEVGEAGNWRDIPNAFAERWCQKYLQASEDNPFRSSDGMIWRLADDLDAVSLTSSPRRLAFNVTLALGLPAQREEAFAFASMGWGQRNEHGMYEISTEAVLRSDDGIHWTVEALNTGGSAGWGWRNLKDDDAMTNIRYALENDEPIILLRVLPNLDWNELTTEETAAAMRMLPEAAVSDEPGYADGKDQLYRDLYMLWGLKRADGAYAELYLDGPDSILARQRHVDPEAFDAALAEMDDATQRLVRLSKQSW